MHFSPCPVCWVVLADHIAQASTRVLRLGSEVAGLGYSVASAGKSCMHGVAD